MFIKYSIILRLPAVDMPCHRLADEGILRPTSVLLKSHRLFQEFF